MRTPFVISSIILAMIIFGIIMMRVAPDPIVMGFGWAMLVAFGLVGIATEFNRAKTAQMILISSNRPKRGHIDTDF